MPHIIRTPPERRKIRIFVSNVPLCRRDETCGGGGDLLSIIYIFLFFYLIYFYFIFYISNNGSSLPSRRRCRFPATSALTTLAVLTVIIVDDESRRGSYKKKIAKLPSESLERLIGYLVPEPSMKCGSRTRRSIGVNRPSVYPYTLGDDGHLRRTRSFKPYFR